MLILSRRVNETIMIGEGPNAVEIMVVEITPFGQVRLGIKAPRTIPVHRKEIYDRIQNNAKSCDVRTNGPKASA